MTDGPSIGTLADEAGQLLDAVAARLTRLRTAEDPADETDPAKETHPPAPLTPEPAAAAGHDPALACVAWCPICRSAGVLHGERSEVADKLMDAALTLVTILRSLLPAADAPTGRPGSPAGHGTADSGAAPGPRIERIDIR